MEEILKPIKCKQSVTEEFINSVITNIEQRFPSNDILSAYSVLSMRPISHLSPEQLETYGRWLQDPFAIKEFSILCCIHSENKVQSVHHFSDASEAGYGAVYYLHLKDDKVHTGIIMAKSCLAPIQ